MILTKENINKVDFDFLISEKIEQEKTGELLLIVPTNRKVRTLKKQLISSMKKKSAHGINIETLGTLASNILNFNQPFRSLSEAASTVFIKQSASEVNLKYFSVYKREIPFGTLDRLKNIISEYKLHGITPEYLRSESQNLEKSEKLKAEDIAAIYEIYLRKCQKLNAFELGDIYQGIVQLESNEFVKTFKEIYSQVDLIIVNGFDQFTILEQNIINQLSKLSGIKLLLNFDYNENNPSIFYHLQKCFKKFHEMGFKQIKDLSEERNTKFSTLIREKLFNNYKGKKYNYTDSIMKVAAFNRESEVELISREIKQLISEQNVECHKIAVVFNQIQNYSSIVRDVFEKNGIPFNLTDRISLENSNPVTALINFIEIAENDFYYKNIFRAVSSGFLNTENIDLANLFRVASELKIVSGKQNWITSLNDSINSLKNDSDDNEEETSIKRRAYQKALADIKEIVKLLSPFEKSLSIAEFENRLTDFVNGSKLPFKLLAVQNNQEENIRGFAAFIDIVSEVFDLLEDEFGNDKKFNLSFFMDNIRTACSWSRFNVKEKSNFGVQITNLNELRGLQFDYLFIGGLVDGDLPTRYQPEIFHVPSFKKQAFIHQTEERNLFYQSLLTWNKKLYLTYPQTEGGRESVVSSFLTDFEELFVLTNKTEEDYQQFICSKEEVQIEAGKQKEINKGSDLYNAAANLSIDFDWSINKTEIELQREVDPFFKSEYNGFILSDEYEEDEKVKKYLNEYSSRQYSISQLETYAKCPFKFFIEKVLKVDSVEEPNEEIESIELGRILHSILFRFYSTVTEKGLEVNSCDEEKKSALRKIIFDIAEDEISRTPLKSPLSFFEIEKLLGINGNFKDSILNKFIEYECENNVDLNPAYFEVRFGTMKDEDSDTKLSSSAPLKIDNIQLRGKIDRIDISQSSNSFDVVDYKLSGQKPTFKELKEGISLQLPVYLLAAAELLRKKYKKEFNPNAMIIFSLKYSLEKFGKQKVVSTDKEITTMDKLIESTISHIKKYIQQISEGQFFISPHEEREKLVCKYCGFSSVCRVNNLVQ